MKAGTMTVSEFAAIVQADPYKLSKSAREHPERFMTLPHFFVGEKMVISRVGAYRWLAWTKADIQRHEEKIRKEEEHGG